MVGNISQLYGIFRNKAKNNGIDLCCFSRIIITFAPPTITYHPTNMTLQAKKYEEWLTTIANTRLMYNTIDELEDVLDYHSLSSNPIKRTFPTLQKLRSAFRDLKGEAELMTEGYISLDSVLEQYHRAWKFFRKNLYRRTNPQQIATELLTYCYSPNTQLPSPIGGSEKGLGTTRKARIYHQVVEENINVPFLVLMLMKAIPGYDSRDGDARQLPEVYDKVIDMLERFTCSGTMFLLLPTIVKARGEKHKTRLTLLSHVTKILDTYAAYSNPANLYDTAADLKQSRCNPDIVGFWNECEGQLLYTDFWQIEDALEYGSYFMTHWHKDADNCLVGIRYTLFIIEAADGGLIYYIIHPEAIKQRMKGKPYTEANHAWYHTEWLGEHPDQLPLQRAIHTDSWCPSINLTRCNDDNVTEQYTRWIDHECHIVKKFAELEYVFHPNIYAITQTHIYIPTAKEGEYYKIPKTASEGLDRIQLTDNVGTMQMNGKTYLAFDELLLYIGTSKKEMQQYGIECVSRIE